MKRFRSSRFAASSVVVAASVAASTAHAEQAPATATATIYQPSTLASLLDLNFGAIVADDTGGVIHLDEPSDNRSCPANLTCTGNFAFATLELTGSNAIVQVTYDPVVQLNGPGAPMDVALQFPGGSGALVPITNNAVTIRFGADLTVNPSQTPGDYSGLFTVNVSYP